MRILNAEFLYGSPSYNKLKGNVLPEIGILGRSNVGKSSFINRLAGRKLARSSSTPGRTQEINLFEIRLGISKTKEQKVILADLPGFGFAKFSKEKREKMSELTVRYLTERVSLQIICLLNDVRREPEEDEIAIRNLVLKGGRPFFVIATKADKLSKNELNKSLKMLEENYQIDSKYIIPTGENIPVTDLWRDLLAQI